MPTPLGHSLWSVSMLIFFRRGRMQAALRLKKELPLIIFCIFLGVLPDFDILIAFAFQNRFLHRAFIHSFVFVLFAVLIFSPVLKSANRVRYPFLLTFFLTGGHVFWDLFTKCDRIPYGTMVLYPFNRQFYKAPFVIFSGFDWAAIRGIMSAAFVQQISTELLIFLPLLFLSIFVNRRRRGFRYESCLNQA